MPTLHLCWEFRWETVLEEILMRWILLHRRHHRNLSFVLRRHKQNITTIHIEDPISIKCSPSVGEKLKEPQNEHVRVHSESATVLLAKLTFSVYLMAYTRGWCLMLKPAPASHTDQFQSRNWNIEICAVLYQLTFRPIFVRLKKSPLRADKIDWTDNDWQHPGFYSQSQAEPLQSILTAISLQSRLLIMIFPPIYAVKLPLF